MSRMSRFISLQLGKKGTRRHSALRAPYDGCLLDLGVGASKKETCKSPSPRLFSAFWQWGAGSFGWTGQNTLV